MSVAQTIIPIFLLILLGVAMRRWFGLREDFWPQLDRLIYFVFFPALLFNTLAHFEIDFGAATPMLMVATLFMCAGMVIGYVAKYFLHAPAKVYSATFQTSFRFNSYVGLAIAGYQAEPSWRTLTEKLKVVEYAGNLVPTERPI